MNKGFAIHNQFHFKAMPNNRVIFNGELALPAEEINGVIDRILSTGLVFQSFHQHFFNLDPQIWHVHLRGAGACWAASRSTRGWASGTTSISGRWRTAGPRRRRSLPCWRRRYRP